MNILLIYGFHKPETEFGRFVCDEYFRKYLPDKEQVVAREIKNSCMPGDNPANEIAYQEVASYIESDKPSVLIDIHNSRPIFSDLKIPLKNVFEPEKPKEKKGIFAFIEKWFGFKSFEEIAYESAQNSPLRRVYEKLSKPLLVTYGNPEVDQFLFNFILGQKDIGFMTDYSTEKSSSSISKLKNTLNESDCLYTRVHKIASENNNSYIGIEAMLHGENGIIEKDEYYYSTAEKAVEFIRRIERFVAENSMQPIPAVKCQIENRR